MPKIDVATAPTGAGTRYPAPYDAPCRDRSWLKLGEAAGLTQFGVNLVRLAPGVWSSQRHWHALEDEFVYVVAGAPTLATDAGEEVLRPGDCAGFKAGDRDGHCFKNLTDADVVLLVVGSRNDDDWGEYSDIDMKFLAGRYAGSAGFVRKSGDPI